MSVVPPDVEGGSWQRGSDARRAARYRAVASEAQALWDEVLTALASYRDVSPCDPGPRAAR